MRISLDGSVCAIAESLDERGLIVQRDTKAYVVAPAGQPAWFAALGVEVISIGRFGLWAPRV
jgi:hypothetical protein